MNGSIEIEGVRLNEEALDLVRAVQGTYLTDMYESLEKLTDFILADPPISDPAEILSVIRIIRAIKEDYASLLADNEDEDEE